MPEVGIERGIYERKPGSGIYYIRFVDAYGKNQRRKIGTLPAARIAYAKALAAKDEGKNPTARPKRVVSFGELCDDYIVRLDQIATSKIKNGDKRYVNTDGSRVKQLKEFFGAKPAERIRMSDFRAFYATFKAYSHNRMRTVMNSVYNLGIENEKISRNPSLGPRSDKRFLQNQQIPDGRKRYLKPEEETALRASILALCPERMDDLDIVLNCGLRKKELYSRISWPNVDFTLSVLTVPTSKTGLGRTIHLNTSARNAFLRLNSRTNAKDPMFKETTNRWFEVVAKHAGLEDIRFHDLRHTFATRMANAGVPMTAIQALLGHSDLRMTSRYSHATDATLIAAVAKLDTLSQVPVPTNIAQAANFNN